MSDLIRSWLNDEVQLSRKITDFEKDFNNGYLFGELLSKFNQQMDFDSFVNSDQRQNRLNNFRLLEPVLKSLRIKFSAQIADGILKEKRGEALKVLYQLKMALEKVNNPADINIFNATGKLNTIAPLKKIEPRKEQFDNMESSYFMKRLNQTNKAQKVVNLEKKLEKFEEAGAKNLEKVRMYVEEEKLKDLKTKEEIRKVQLNKLQRNISFMENWTTKGWENWRKNQDIKHTREQKEKEFEQKMATKTFNEQTRKENMERQDVTEGIAEFEGSLAKFGIEKPAVDEDGEMPKRLEKSAFSTAAFISNLHEKKLLTEEGRNQRDKRRRKMIVDQARQQREVEIRKREEILQEKISVQSKQEKEIDYENWRAYQSKNIILENRNLRETKYERKREDIVYQAQQQEEYLFGCLQEERNRDIEQKTIRQKELAIEHQTGKRIEHYQMCDQLMDFIFEAAELCFQHQQDRDTEEIDPRFWRECTTLFIEDKPLLPRQTFRHYNSTKVLSEPPTSQIEESSNQLDETELSDYINGNGQWKPMHKFNGPENDDDAKYIPNQPINNFLLGGVVETIIDLFYPEKREIVKPDVPSYMPLKLVVTGYSFSGKRTLCKFLKEKYGLEVLQVDEIIREFIELASFEGLEGSQLNKVSKDNFGLKELAETSSNKLPEEQEGEQHSQPAQDRSNQQIAREADYLNPDAILESPPQNSNVDYKAFGAQIRKILVSGKPIPEEIYIQAIVLKIRQLFPNKTEQELAEEFQEAKKKFESYVPPKSQGSPRKSSQKDLAAAEKERKLKTLSTYYNKGWILLGFPNNYDQAKALEKALTGYVPDDELPSTIAEIKKQEAAKIVRAMSKTIVPRKLIKGGIDAAIVLEVTKAECLRRALGRRIDLNTQKIYHIDDNPPPMNQSPLVEYLVPINSPDDSELVIVEKHNYYDINSQQVEDWFRNFGFEALQLSCLQKFDGSGAPIDIHTQVDELLTRILQLKQQEFDAFLEELATRKQREQEAEEERQRQEYEDARMTVTEREQLQDQLALLSGGSQELLKRLTPNILNVLVGTWEESLQKYIQRTKNVFRNIREQRNFQNIRIAEIQRRFLQNVTKKDDKLSHVLKFQREYNKFVDENKDMCEEDSTKEELHQRVEDLYQLLWEMIENKKEEALEERKQIVNSGYIESELEFFMASIQKLLQAELDRYYVSAQLLQDYYNTLENKDLADSPENPCPELVTQPDLLPPIESPDPNAFPRLEKLYNDSIRILNGEEVEEIKTDKKGAKIPPKKDDKKGTKKGQPEPEEPKEPTQLEKELKQAVNTEKAIVRYRLYMIKTLAESRIKEMRIIANALYSKLDDWIYYSVKVENEALYQITRLFRRAIEDQEKIQNELQLNYVDVVFSHRYLNFIDPPPVLLPAKELPEEHRFTISQLYILIQELRNIANDLLIIDSTAVYQFLLRRLNSSVSKNDFPKEWQTFTPKDLQRLVQNLDPQSTGSISFKALATFCALYDAPIADEMTVESMKETLHQVANNGAVGREEFVETPFWFDDYVASEPMQDHSVYFDRARMIKELLFYINKDSQETLNVEFFARLVRCQEYINTETEANVEKAYRHVLFDEN